MSCKIKTRTGREVKVTEKMQEYLKQVAEGETSRRRRALLSEMRKLGLKGSSMDFEQLHQKYQALEKDRQELTELEQQETDTLSSEEKGMYSSYFEEDIDGITEAEMTLKTTLQEKESPDNKESQEITSGKESQEHTVRGPTEAPHDDNTQPEIDQQAERSRLAELENKRELLVQKNKLEEERRRLEDMQRELQRKQEMWELEAEMQRARARLGQSTNASSDSMARPQVTSTPYSHRESTAEASGDLPNVSMNASNRSIEERLEGAFLKAAEAVERNSHNIVRIEPETFDGTVLKFSSWLAAFEDLVQEVKPQRRMIYLLKYTEGRAKETIEHLSRLEPVVAYQEAMKTLKDRYNSKFRVYEAFKEKLDQWPFIKDGDGTALQRYSDFLNSCLTAMTQICYLDILNDFAENVKMTRKLSRRMVDRWSNRVDDWLQRNEDPRYEFPPFEVYVDFIKRQARIETGPVKLSMAKMEAQRAARSRVNLIDSEEVEEEHEGIVHSAAVNYAQTYGRNKISKPAAEQKCPQCDRQHGLATCPQFLKLDMRARHIASRKWNLCKSCLQVGHYMRGCSQPDRCKKCGKIHHTIFHDEDYKSVFKQRNSKNDSERDKKQGEDKATVNCINSKQKECSLILPVRLWSEKTKRQITVYAVLDCQSDTCFILEKSARRLDASGPRVNLEMETMAGTSWAPSEKISDLMITGLDDAAEVKLPKVYLKERINSDYDQIACPDAVRKWEHLEKIADDLKHVDRSLDIGLLLGRNCTKALKPHECIPGEDDQPYAVHTKLGWGVVGPLIKGADYEKQDRAMVNRTGCREISPIQVLDMFQRDFSEHPEAEKLSQEDRDFIEMLEKGIQVTEDGHFMLPLPLKNEDPMPDNQQQALALLRKLKQRMDSDPDFAQKYREFMHKIISRGYAEKVKGKGKKGRVWYISHHGVPQGKKLRVVFHNSLKYRGVSLNQKLMVGPDMTNKLTGVLCRFRKPKVGVQGDIECMFYQVFMTEDHRDYTRFWWWPDGDTTKEPEEYRMTVHPFGASSSPGCANFTLKKVAEVYGAEFDPEVAAFLRDNFYVDDGLGGRDDVESAAQLILDTRALCAKGGFNFTKVVSNEPEVLERIPAEARAELVESKELGTDCGPLGKTLGMYWSLLRDCFTFKIDTTPKPKTRRGVLSTVSAIYDPLGFLAPFLMLGKLILQNICKENKDWDEPLTPSSIENWEDWLRQLPELQRIHVKRCFQGKDMDKIARVELHHFADASFLGYGACSYVRMIDIQGRIEVSLVMSKSRVAPAKTMTIPRLELVAALVAARLAQSLVKELQYPEVENYYYSDSMVALGYITNLLKRFHPFVANRASEIRDLTDVNRWAHIDGKNNPADLASRGMSAVELRESKMWFEGPEFLKDPNFKFERIQDARVDDDDKEVKKEREVEIKARVNQVRVSEEMSRILEVLGRASKWSYATGIIARALSWKLRHSKKDGPALDAIEIKMKASESILRMSQHVWFPEEHSRFEEVNERDLIRQRKKKESGDYRLRKLDIMKTPDGLLRVGGRLKNAEIPFHEKHPALMDKRCTMTSLLIMHAHRKQGHARREPTLNELRRMGVWIVSPRSAIDAVLDRCIICRRLKSQPAAPKMADLPSPRVQPQPPFTVVGADFFGPFRVKITRKATAKRYGVIYTCLASRAVYLDVAAGLSTSDFICSYKRFTSRRGPVRVLKCDRGTNFVGAQKKLEMDLDEMKTGEIRERLAEMNCEFVTFEFNPPHASHMGGVWERLIRSARGILNSLMLEQGSGLTDDSLRTVMAETEAIMNSKPLTYVDGSDADSLTPLSPSDLLTMKPRVPPPPIQKIDSSQAYAAEQWRRVQLVTEQFWSRWRGEILPNLQIRRKWTKETDPLKEGDVVLMMDEQAPRMDWVMAVVKKAERSADGQVRVVTIKTRGKEYVRPAHKVIRLIPGRNPVEEA